LLAGVLVVAVLRFHLLLLLVDHLLLLLDLGVHRSGVILGWGGGRRGPDRRSPHGTP
jgi:hypothetical protein